MSTNTILLSLFFFYFNACLLSHSTTFIDNILAQNSRFSHIASAIVHISHEIMMNIFNFSNQFYIICLFICVSNFEQILSFVTSFVNLLVACFCPYIFIYACLHIYIFLFSFFNSVLISHINTISLLWLFFLLLIIK